MSASEQDPPAQVPLPRKATLDYLPTPLKKHLNFPRKVFAIWLLLMGALIALSVGRMPNMTKGLTAEHDVHASESPHVATRSNLLSEAREDSSSKDYLAFVGEVKVSGNSSFKIKSVDGKARFQGEGLQKAYFRRSDQQLYLIKNGVTHYRLKPKTDGQINLYDSRDSRAFKIKQEGQEYKIYDSSNTRIYKLKIKTDKFNIYDAEGTRIQSGKFKDGAYKVKAHPSETRVLKIKGVRSLKEAAWLALPIPEAYRALLFVEQRVQR
jgi:hypothetical protein